jgi:UDP-N-acetylmuramyl pentapeptide phosphotransferase/UDP-N-acetylglucosamine-1-phosphate transferase
MVGLIISILVIKFINIAPTNRALAFTASPAIAFSLLLIPLLDTLRLFSLRIFSRRSPFMPDRNHIHHILLDKGFSHRQITLALVLSHLVVVIFTCTGFGLGTTPLIFISTCLFFTALGVLRPGNLGSYSKNERPFRQASVKTISIYEGPLIKKDAIVFKEN